MDPKISALQNAASKTQLKAAADALPREGKYYTIQVRDLLLQKQKFIVDAATAHAVVAFFRSFTHDEAVRSVLRTREIRDLIINILAPKIGAGDPVESLADVLCGIVQTKPAAELYSTPESFKAILSCFHRAATAASADCIASSINNILVHNPSAKKLLNDLPVVEAFSALLPRATTVDAVKWVSKTLAMLLRDNYQAQEMFVTRTFFEKFKTIEKHANSEAAKNAFKSVVVILQSIAKRKVMEESLRDATTSQELACALSTIMRQSDFWPSLVELLLAKQNLIEGKHCTTLTAKFIKLCSGKNERIVQNRKIICELIEKVLLVKSLNYPSSIHLVHKVLAFVVKNHKDFFSTTSFKEYIIASLPHSNKSILALLNSLLGGNKKGQEIFGTPDFNEMVCHRFAENPSATALLESFEKIMNDLFTPVRFNSLKKLVLDHKETIPERILRQLAQSGVDSSTLFECDNAVLACELPLDDVFAVSRFVKNIKNKNNGVAPVHQDPFKLFELDKLRQEHDDLRKLHQDLILSCSKEIVDLKLELENEKKNHAASTTKLNQEIAIVVADRDAKEKTLTDLQNTINGLEINVADEKKRTSNLEKSLDDTKTQLQSAQKEISALQSQLAAISPFVKDKFYQIEYGILNLPQPQTGVVADLRPVPSQSRIFAEAEKLMKKGGTLVFDSTSPSGFKFSPVKGFTLQSVDVILRNAYSFEERMDRLQGLRADLTDKFNPAFAAFSPEQQQVLKVLFEHFLPRPPNANKKFPNLVNVFHGTKIDCLDSAIKGLVAMKSTDEGFFGFGCYTTTSIEYAAKYARGDFDPAGPSSARADGCYPVLWCVAAVGVCNPVSRADDYSKNRVDKTFGAVSDFFGSPLSRNCDCHCALVGGSQSYQAVAPQNMEYLEIVVDQENQVIPIAVLWVNP